MSTMESYSGAWLKLYLDSSMDALAWCETRCIEILVWTAHCSLCALVSVFVLFRNIDTSVLISNLTVVSLCKI